MNEPSDREWTELGRLWQANAPATSMREIESHLRRERRQLVVVSIAEWSALAVGAIAASWLLLLTPLKLLGVIVAGFSLASAWISVRLKRPPPAIGGDLLQSLKGLIAREDWLIGQLRVGWALSLMALAAIVVTTSMQLLMSRAFSAGMMLAATAGCGVAVLALVWSHVLQRRSHARRKRLEELSARMNS